VDPRLGMLIKARRAVFAILAVLSTVGALALIYAAFGSGDSRLTPTTALIGIFVLLVFPAATTWAWAWDRNVRTRTARSAARERVEPGEPAIEHPGGRRRREAAAETSVDRKTTSV